MEGFSFDWKYKDFEIRTVNAIGGHPYVELVKWAGPDNERRYCYTLAYFSRDRDAGYELHFVADRPLTEIAEMDLSEIWKQLWLAQMMFEDAEERMRDEHTRGD